MNAFVDNLSVSASASATDMSMNQHFLVCWMVLVTIRKIERDY